MTLINDYRAENGLGPLSVDPSLQAASEWMSTDLGEQNYFSHTDSLGRSPWDRMCDFNYCHNTWKAENIAAGYDTAEAAFDGWRNSPGHNSNMLGENYLVMGIALVYTPGSTYGYYWTNDFGGYVAEPPPPPAPTSTPSPDPTPAPTASPSPTASPAPATPAPTETPSPAPTPAPTLPSPPSFTRADVNCDGAVTAADVMALLRFVGGLAFETPPGCPAIGSGASGAQAASHGAVIVQGDVDCNSVVDAADVRSVLLSAGDLGPLPACDA